MIIVKSFNSSQRAAIFGMQEIDSGIIINSSCHFKLDHFQFQWSLIRDLSNTTSSYTWGNSSKNKSLRPTEAYCKLPNTTGGMPIVKIPENSWNDERVNMAWPYVAKMGNEAFCFHRKDTLFCIPLLLFNIKALYTS